MASIVGPHFPDAPLFMQALVGDPEINYSAQQFGELHRSIWASPGILTATSFHVEQADTPGWAIKIRPGRATLGRYLVWNFSEQTIDISVFNTSPVGTRTHYVYLCVWDKEAHGDDGYYANIRVVEDFGSGVNPPDAAATLLLAAFTISPGQSNILNSHIFSRPINASAYGPFVDIKGEDFLNNLVNGNNINGTGTVVADIGPARARYGQGRVQLSGGIWRAVSPAASFAVSDPPMQIGTLPFYLRPEYDVWLTLASSHFKPWKLHIQPDGDMYAHIADDSLPLYLYFDGATYEVD